MATTAQIKAYFEDKDRPTQAQFAALIDFTIKSVIHVDDYGASPSNTGQQNQTAIQNAVNAAKAAGGTQLIQFGIGEYTVETQGGAGVGGQVFDWDDGTYDNLVFRGHGRASILKIAAGDYSGGSDPHMFNLRNSSNLVFQDLMFDGNQPNHTGVQEQFHLFNVVDCDNLAWINCTFTRSHGDGIKILGNTQQTANLQVLGCEFLGCKRAGVVMQRRVDRIVIDGCLFDGNDLEGNTIQTDQLMDFEPTGSDGIVAADNIVSNCIFHSRIGVVAGVTFGGPGTDAPLSRTIVSGCTFLVDSLRFFKTRDLLFIGNTVKSFGTGSPTDLIDVLSQNENIVFSHCNLANESDTCVIGLNAQSDVRPSRVIIDSCQMRQNGDFHAIRAENGADGLKLMNNWIIGNSDTAVDKVGLRLRENPTVPGKSNGLYSAGNTFQDFSIGIQSVTTDSASNGYDSWIARDNSFVDCSTGVSITASADNQFSSTPVIDNSYSGVTTNISFSGITHYATSDGQYRGTAVPSFAASNGDTFSRDGGSDSSVYFYLGGVWQAYAPALATVLASDTFTEASNTILSSHTPSSDLNGNGWALSTASNYQVSASTDEAVAILASDQIAVIDVESSDVEVNTDIRLVSTSGFGGVVVRYTDADNYLAFLVKGDGSEIKWLKRVGGVETASIDSVTGLSLSGTVRMRVKINGSVLTGDVDGNTVTISDSFNSPETSHGIYSDTASRFYFDDFQIIQ